MWGAGGAGLEPFESLVAKVKELQKTSLDAKEQWGIFTDLNGGGTRDPTKHSPDFLQGFLDHVSSGHRISPGQGLGKGGAWGAAPAENPTLADSIKILQRRSEGFKETWARYCMQQGGGKFDPMKHSAEFMLQFLNNLATGHSGMGPAPIVGGSWSGGEPPMKRMRDSSGAGVGSSGSGDPVKDQLVAQIKSFQRLGVEQKELWWMYADTYLGGWRDPVRHDAAALHEFCANHDVPKADVSAAPGGLGGIGTGSMPTMRARPAMSGLGPKMMAVLAIDPSKEGLVNRIKVFQKASRENADTWTSFCGSTKDPNKHDTAKLQEFCRLFAVL